MEDRGEGGGPDGFGVLDRLFKATQSIRAARNAAELVQALSEGFATFGFQSFNMGLHKPNKYELALNATLVTWSLDFTKEYERAHWGDCDPTLERAAMAEQAFRWSIHDPQETTLKQSYIDYLVTTPLKGGIVVPLPRRPGSISSISVESHTRSEFSDATMFWVSTIANTGMMKAEALGLCRQTSVDEALSASALSPVQIEILKWAAAGKSNLDIATILGLTKRNVEYHLSQTFRKLGVVSRSQAIVAYFGRVDSRAS
ncbi:MAG: autoinducer binding domain-containing protein [Devosia sp.]|nr:autoinducer binding domain-containing protein [Devosia sp.]